MLEDNWPIETGLSYLFSGCQFVIHMRLVSPHLQKPEVCTEGDIRLFGNIRVFDESALFSKTLEAWLGTAADQTISESENIFRENLGRITIHACQHLETILVIIVSNFTVM